MDLQLNTTKPAGGIGAGFDPKTLPYERFMPIGEACDMAGGVSQPTLRKMIRERDFPKPYRLLPNRICFSLHEVIAWIEAEKATLSRAV